MVRKRMDVPYLNVNMEGVRQVALRNFKVIYEDFLKDLKSIISDDMGYYFGFQEDKYNKVVEKYEELKDG